MIMKKLLATGMICVMGLGLTGCTIEESTARQEQKYQEELMQRAADTVGQPSITNFYEKKLAKEIFEKRDDTKLICYVYNQNIDGKYVFIGKSIGYGLPYSTQYTNPETAYWGRTAETSTTSYRSYPLPQPEPNGLYTAEGLSATWLMMVNEEDGNPYIMYCEPTIVVTETKLPKRLVEEWSLPSNY